MNSSRNPDQFDKFTDGLSKPALLLLKRILPRHLTASEGTDNSKEGADPRQERKASHSYLCENFQSRPWQSWMLYISKCSVQ